LRNFYIRYKRDQPTFFTAFVFGEYNSENAIFNTLKDDTLSKLISKFGDTTAEEKEALKKIFMLFSSLFERKDLHALSGYIGHLHIYTNQLPRTDIFIYPSIQSEKHEFNYAIHPNAVLHLLELSHVYVVRVVK
jgi:hypothetical protein